MTTDPIVVKSQMFGSPTLKTGKKAFVVFHDGEVVFKLTGKEHEQALALGGTHLFEPAAGHRMKEWVVVPDAHSDVWPELAEAAKDYVIKIQMQ